MILEAQKTLDSLIADACEVARQREAERQAYRERQRQEALADCLSQIPSWMHSCIRSHGTWGAIGGYEVILQLEAITIRLTRVEIIIKSISFEWRYWNGSTWAYAPSHEEAIAGAVDAGSHPLPETF